MDNAPLPPGVTLRHTLWEFMDKITDVAWMPDGKTLAVKVRRSALCFWDVESESLVRVVKGLSREGEKIQVSRDGKTIATGPGVLRVLDVESGKVRRVGDGVTAFAISDDGRTLAVVRPPAHDVAIVDIDTYDTVDSFASPHEGIVSVHRAGSGFAIVTPAVGLGAAEVRELQTGSVLSTGESDVSLSWDEESGGLAFGGSSGVVTFLSPMDASASSAEHGGAVVRSIALSRRSVFIAVAREGQVVVELYRRDTLDLVAKFAIPDAHPHDSVRLWFHPTEPTLAAATDRKIHIFELDPAILLAAPQQAIHHTSAKVVLVGESNVGKSCLALRLAEDRYEEQGTTHGMRFWPMDPAKLSPAAAAPAGERRDVVLWDMGGQAEYRLVHQLFLHDTTVALVLFDPTRDSAFDDVRAWNKRLEKQLDRRPSVKLLVGTKLDAELTVTDRAAIERLVRECGFSGYFPTSARCARGLPELRVAIADALQWERLTRVSRPEVFQFLRDEIERRRKKGDVLVLCSELEDLVAPPDAAGAAGPPPDTPPPDTVGAVVEQLALQGMLVDTRLATGERAAVLQIGQIEAYAGSVILAARGNPRGVPAIEERQIASPRMAFPGLADRLPRLQERLVLECVTQLLLQHGVCLQHEGLLIFPALFRPTEADRVDPVGHSVSLYYDFSGAIDNIYSSLVASLTMTESFGRLRLWEDRAEFDPAGNGACGFKKVERGSGFAHLDIFFEESTPDGQRKLFISFVEEHLRRQGVDIYEHVEITCVCGAVFGAELVRGRIAEGHRDVGCARCDRRTPIADGARQAREKDPELAKRTIALRTHVERKRRQIVKEARGLFHAREPAEPAERPVRILHLSDLHMYGDTDVGATLQPLAADLKRGLGVRRLDYLVVSGDLTNRATPLEFERARELISGLIAQFDLTAERCVLVPGNHDLDWNEPVYDWRGRRPDDTRALAAGTYVAENRVLLVRDDKRYANRFRAFAESFFHPLVQREYSLPPEHQCHALLFPDTGIQFITLNSAWEIDEFHPERSSIHPGALSRGLATADTEVAAAIAGARLAPDASILRIAVWHHPVTGNEKIQNDAFVARLRQAGVKLALHGHVHEERTDLVGYLHADAMSVVGAGSFGAPAGARPESTPRLYNLIEVARDLRSARIHTRSLDRAGGAWRPWAVWPSDRSGEMRGYYVVKF